MDNVILFPAIHFIDGSYWHGSRAYTDLATLEASLSEFDRRLAVMWQQRRERWQASRKRGNRRDTASNGGSAA